VRTGRWVLRSVGHVCLCASVGYRRRSYLILCGLAGECSMRAQDPHRISVRGDNCLCSMRAPHRIAIRGDSWS
jgi:hypothetical protein